MPSGKSRNNRKEKKPAKRRAQNGSRAGHSSLRGIQQGVSRTVGKSFGNSGGPGCFDATVPAHLALPIATGPYTTMRVTQLISSGRPIMVFGTFRGAHTYLDVGTALAPLIPPVLKHSEGWAPYCAVGSVADVGATTPSDSAVWYLMSGLSQLGDMATIVPSALTVQIMNPNALQTTNGILYVGRMKTQFRGEDSTEQWTDLANQFVSYQAPRLCSAGKLALRGVKIDACPFNVRELQDFDRVIDPMELDGGGGVGGFDEPWTSTSRADSEQAYNPQWKCKGFAPIMVYNPNAVSLQYLVTLEFRCRFDLGHPASSTHVHHQPATESTWSGHIKRMLDMGHGVIDIADAIAEGGALLNRALPYAQTAQLALGM